MESKLFFRLAYSAIANVVLFALCGIICIYSPVIPNEEQSLRIGDLFAIFSAVFFFAGFGAGIVMQIIVIRSFLKKQDDAECAKQTNL